MTLPRIVVQPGRVRPFFGRHPWVFAGAIARVEGDPADGAEVDLVTPSGTFIARGLYNSQSKIRVRLYSWEERTSLDRDFFAARLRAAIRWRHDVLGWQGPETACRLVFSEADGLSGCTVDRYDRWLVVQFTSLALAQRRDLMVDLLREILAPEGIMLRTEKGIRDLEGLDLHDQLLWGEVPAEPIRIREGPVVFRVHLREGQKTGFYLDQRDNRQRVAALARGRRMLDAFCYTGGFGLHAAQAGAQAVEGVDVSEPALELARGNAHCNRLDNLEFIRRDVFTHLAERAEAGERFGLVVLDPPRFARTREAIGEALRGYRRLHALALRLLEPEGILVSCCCSGLITGEMLTLMLAELAAEMGRDIQLMEQRGAAADHPVSVSCLESNYLKCLISRVR